MPKFRKKPLVVEAEQWQPTMTLSDADRLGVEFDEGGTEIPERGWFIRTLEGCMKLNYGDWVITGVANETYPCKDHIFRQTYEPA